MLRDRPYEEWIILLYLEVALHEVGSWLVGSLALESLVPTLEVVQAEALHIEFLHTLCLDDVHRIALAHRGVATVGRVASGTDGRDVLAGIRVVLLVHVKPQHVSSTALRGGTPLAGVHGRYC